MSIASPSAKSIGTDARAVTGLPLSSMKIVMVADGSCMGLHLGDVDDPPPRASARRRVSAVVGLGKFEARAAIGHDEILAVDPHFVAGKDDIGNRKAIDLARQ